VVESLITSGIEDHTFGPINLRAVVQPRRCVSSQSLAKTELFQFQQCFADVICCYWAK